MKTLMLKIKRSKLKESNLPDRIMKFIERYLMNSDIDQSSTVSTEISFHYIGLDFARDKITLVIKFKLKAV